MDKLTLTLPINGDGTIASLEAFQEAMRNLVYHAHVDWGDKAVLDAFLEPFRETSPNSPDMERVFGVHLLQKELVLFHGDNQDEFDKFAQNAESDEDVSDFAIPVWDSTETFVESLELSLFSRDKRIYRQRLQATARFLTRTGVARGATEEVFALLNLSGVELITILPA